MKRYTRAQVAKAVWSALAELREECRLDCAGRNMSQRVIRVGNFQRREKRLLDYLQRGRRVGELPADLRELVDRHLIDTNQPVLQNTDSSR